MVLLGGYVAVIGYVGICRLFLHYKDVIVRMACTVEAGSNLCYLSPNYLT